MLQGEKVKTRKMKSIHVTGEVLPPFSTVERKAVKPKRWLAITKRIPFNCSIAGAEIGILRGVNASHILEACPDVVHFMVDPWDAGNKDESYINSGATDGKEDQAFFDGCFRDAMRAIEPYKDRAIVIRKKSVDAAREINLPLDYVFIDGDHSYEGVKRDIAAWLPKIRPGGWIGGHDYGSHFPGVDQAVKEAFPLDSIEIDIDHTWFVRVNG